MRFLKVSSAFDYVYVSFSVHVGFPHSDCRGALSFAHLMRSESSSLLRPRSTISVSCFTEAEEDAIKESLVARGLRRALMLLVARIYIYTFAVNGVEHSVDGLN